MPKEDIVIAIRTYGRIDTIEANTLSVVKDLGLPIYIFCGTDEVKEYRKKFRKEGYKIRDGKGPNGLTEANKAIYKHFNINQKLLLCDDDLKAFWELQDDKLVKGDLLKYILRGFKECEDNNFKLFGFYPVRSSRYMNGRKEITKGLNFCVGGMNGIINDKELINHTSLKEDYERSVQHYIKYGGSIRFNQAHIQHGIYTKKGGLSSMRTQDKMKEECDYLLKEYPNYIAVKKSKSEYTEIQLKQIKYSIAHHLLANLRLITWSNNCSRPNVSGKDETRSREGRLVGKPCLSYTFGYLRPRRAKKGTLELTRVSERFPFVYNLIKEWLKELKPDFIYSAICVNKNIKCEPHKDKYNTRLSLAVGLGDYTGGNLIIEGVKHNINNKPLEFDGNKTHWNDDFEGERFSFIFIHH